MITLDIINAAKIKDGIQPGMVLTVIDCNMTVPGKWKLKAEVMTDPTGSKADFYARLNDISPELATEFFNKFIQPRKE